MTLSATVTRIQNGIFKKQRNQRARTRIVAPISLALCLVSVALHVTSLATPYWFQSGCTNEYFSASSGSVNFGLFSGSQTLRDGITPEEVQQITRVCKQNKCMYSCGVTSDVRLKELQLVLDEDWTSLETFNCEEVRGSIESIELMRDEEPAVKRWFLEEGLGVEMGTVFQEKAPGRLSEDSEGGLHEAIWRRLRNQQLRPRSNEQKKMESEISSTSDSPAKEPQVTEYMSFGLWVSTVVFLSAGLLFAVIGALFAVVNTATTPVEAITGVPGLYVWNALAVLFDFTCIVCWSVEFHANLSSNIFLGREAVNGWNTKDSEVFGFSFWLTLVAMFIHIFNVGLIFIGNFDVPERHVVVRPDSKVEDILW